MKNINFFISFDYFKFSDLKTEDLNNLKNHFLYFINLEFNKILKTCDSNVNLFHQKILGNNNNLLFYTGVESHLRSKIDPYKNKIYESFNYFFNNKNLIDKEIFCVKIKIGKGNKNQQFSLGCLLLVVNYKNIDLDINSNEIIRFYILFPFRYGDFHK